MKTLVALLILVLLPAASWAATCTISGVVYNPDGTPLANGQVQFNSIVTQVLGGGATVPPQFISTTTDPQGNLKPFAAVQGLQGQFTFCNPMAGGCSAPTTALIPLSATADISAILSGIQLASGGNVNANSLNVSGNTTLGGTLTVAGASTFNGPLSMTGNACFADLGCWGSQGIVQVTHVGIGPISAVGAALLQVGNSLIGSNTYTDSLGIEPNMNFATGVHNTASQQIADVKYPMWYNQVGGAANGSEHGWFVFGPATIGQPASGLPRVQYMALRPNVPGVQAGLFIESGGIDIINGGLTVNGGALGTGISLIHNQNTATTIATQNPSSLGNAAGVVRAQAATNVTDMGIVGTGANLGGWFTADRGYVASNGSNGLLIEATGGGGAASALYLSAPNSNRVLVIGNQHFGTSNDGVSFPTANAAACGGSGSVFGTSTDTSGSVNIGPTAVNSCVVTFAAAFPSVACVCSARANTWCSINPSASGFTMGFGTNITGYASWICWENGE